MICCVAECGVCGGKGCGTFGEDYGLGRNDCCTNSIKTSGITCSDSPEAPCIIDAEGGGDDENDSSDDEPYSFLGCITFNDEADADTGVVFASPTDMASEKHCYNICSNQEAVFFAMTEGDTCVCGNSTSFCGNSTDLSESICSDGICDMECVGDSDQWCGGVDAYDLYEIHEFPTCSNGLSGVESESGDVCCPLGCGTCGGDRCKGEGSCCENTIQLSGNLCEDGNYPPCIINENPFATPSPVTPINFPPSAPTSPTFCDLDSGDIPGVESEDSSTCCPEYCTVCYSLNEDCTGIYDCCADKIHEIDPVPLCSEGNAAPCVLD